MKYELCSGATVRNLESPGVQAVPILSIEAPAGSHILSRAQSAADLSWLPGMLALVVVLALTGFLRRSMPRWGTSVLRVLRALSATVSVVFILSGVLLQLGIWQANHGKEHESVRVMRLISPQFMAAARVLRWKVNPPEVVAEAAATRGIQRSLERGGTEEAVWFAGWPQAKTEEGMQARVAAFLASARLNLQQGRVDEALALAEKSREADPASQPAFEAEQVARFHLMLRQAQRGEFQKADVNYRRLPESWRPDLQSRAAALIARASGVAYLKSAPPDIDGALLSIEKGRERASRRGPMPDSLNCDLVSVLGFHLQRALGGGDSSAALQLLARVDAAVEDSPLTKEFWPVALVMHGWKELDGGSAMNALSRFEEAERRAEDRSREDRSWEDRNWILEARKGQVGALSALAADEVAEHDFPHALDYMERADKIGHSAETADAMAAVHLRFAAWTGRQGNWNLARKEAQKAQIRGRYSAEANELLQEFKGAPDRVARILSANWSNLPRVAGESRDGEDYLYYDNRAQLIAWAEQANPSKVIYTAGSAHDRVVGMLRDTDGNGYPDEVQEAGPGGTSTVTIDADADFRPDVRLRMVNGSVQSRENLSGNVLVRVASAAVACSPDLLSKADPYYRAYHNREFVFKSSVKDDTQFPRWNEEFPIHFRWRDSLLIQVMDSNPKWWPWGDKEIGRVGWDQLPTSGYYQTSNNCAALEVQVRPAVLPSGYTYKSPPAHNPFETAADEDLGPFRDIVQRARTAQTARGLATMAGRWWATDKMALAMFPEAGVAFRILVSIGLDEVVLEPFFKD